jgi:exosortase
MPLQELAAKVAVGTLNLTGVDAVQGGTKIFMPRIGMPDRTLNVAEACAGMRSLMTFISVAGAVAFLSNRALWQRLIIVVSAIPIAIFCNVMRVAGQGLLDHYVSEELSESFAHQFVGLIMLIPAFFLILMVGWLLDQLFIEEADASGAAVAAKAKAQPGIITARRRSSEITRSAIPEEGA